MGQQSKRRKEKKGLKKIVKVQLSLATNHQFDAALPELMKRNVLVYSQDRQWRYEGPVNAQFVALMDGRDKAYFYATKTGPMLDIDGETPCPQNLDW